MKPLARMILVSSLALAAAGCIFIERTGEYYVATKTMTFGKVKEYSFSENYDPPPFSLGVPGDRDKSMKYLPPSIGVDLVVVGAYMEDSFLPGTLILWPVGIAIWSVESFVLAPIWDTLCLPYDMYLRNDYLEKERQKTDTTERSNP